MAAHADEIYMDPMGTLYIEGYGRFNTYFKSALDKLGINYHIFKIGTYKSAVEPYIRDNMSAEVKQANIAYLGDLWSSYVSDVATARELTEDDINLYSNEFLNNLANSTTESSQLAVSSSLINDLKTRREMRSYLIEKVGSTASGEDYLSINYKTYLKLVNSKQTVAQKSEQAKDKVAVIVAKGVIYVGNKKAGSIGGQSTASLIRRARFDDSVKAVVIRVDSPGGSAYASEIIRREVLETMADGKPVVISMGSYAASGGYWIAASADEIWASPTTITGSIGVYGMLPTFEKPLDKIGVYRDGVGTTTLTGAFDAGRPLREDVGKAIQSSIEQTYQRFLSIVAEGREMTVEQVNEIAQGRVWSGKAAQANGLVDHLGGIEDAIKSAADKSGMVSYEIEYIEQKVSSSEKFFSNMFKSSLLSSINITMDNELSSQQMMLSPTVLLMQELQQAYQNLVQMNDPQNIYAHCLCSLN